MALYNLTTGNDNTAVGNSVLMLNNGGRNTGVGYWAMLGNGTGGENTAVGYRAFEKNRATSYNTALGAWALHKSNVGGSNTAVGWSALLNNQAYENTATGFMALRGNTTGPYNTANGNIALASNTTGRENSALGHGALTSNTLGNRNTAVGSLALYSNTAGVDNTANGRSALYKNTSGYYNTAIGYSALYNTTTGYGNVALGYQAGLSQTTGSYNIYIGGFNFGAAAENYVVRLGSPSYQRKTYIAGIRGVPTGLTGAVAVLIDANGQLGTINSSRRFKDDIQPMGSVSERLFALRPVTFRYKQAYENGSKPVQYGLVAEEVAEVFPELVVYGKDGKPETVAYHVLATLLLNELQKDHRVMQAQAGRIASLEKETARIAALEQQVAVLAQAVELADKSRMVASTR
jgi:hypothetical protein